jgi:L-seryl-tRNA(Ser) seleniumtransferase
MDTESSTPEPRQLPSIDRLLRRPAVEALSGRHGRSAVRDAAREILEEARQKLQQGEPTSTEVDEIEKALRARLDRAARSGLRPVINATGVVLHTNLGRAPLGDAALEALSRTAGRYLNLEMDLETGERGGRGRRLLELVCAVTGAEAACVVNNNAGAVLLMLETMARGREVVVSRGELVEIGGSFRVPDVMAKSGAHLREVGTTNRTRLADYASVCGPETALLLKIHTSNFRMVGFTEDTPVSDLVELGRKEGIPVGVDLGSGALARGARWGLGEEPLVQDVLAAGPDIITFSGDKALGGPQAGYIVGRSDWIEMCRRNPLYRALRVGRLTLAAAEATWQAYHSDQQDRVAVIRMLSADPGELRERAGALAQELRRAAPVLHVQVVMGEGRVGGGAAPEEPLPSVLLGVEAPGMEAGTMASRLRGTDPPVLARVREGKLYLDVRTVLPEEEPELVKAVAQIVD